MLQTGWIMPNKEHFLKNLNNSLAVMHLYFNVPHKTLIISIDYPKEGKETKYFIICHNCELIQMKTTWKIDNFNCSFPNKEDIILEDKKNKIKIECNSIRLLNEEEWNAWERKQEA